MPLVFCVHWSYDCSIWMRNVDGPFDFVEIVEEGDYVFEAAIHEVQVVDFWAAEEEGESSVPICLLSTTEDCDIVDV